MTDWAEVKNKVKVKSVDFTTQIKRLGKHNLGKWISRMNLGVGVDTLGFLLP